MKSKTNFTWLCNDFSWFLESHHKKGEASKPQLKIKAVRVARPFRQKLQWKWNIQNEVSKPCRLLIKLKDKPCKKPDLSQQIRWATARTLTRRKQFHRTKLCIYSKPIIFRKTWRRKAYTLMRDRGQWDIFKFSGWFDCLTRKTNFITSNKKKPTWNKYCEPL